MSAWRVDAVGGFWIAVKSLRNHRMRTVLAITGMSIGVATLLAVLSITQGLDEAFERQLASLGPSSLYISKYPWVRIGKWWKYRNRKHITRAQVDAVRTQCSVCAAVVPIVTARKDVRFLGTELAAVEVVGSTSPWLQVAGYEVTYGRFLSGADETARRKVAVIGADIADAFFKEVNPLGATIRIGESPFVVVGVLNRKGKLFNVSRDLRLVIPAGTHRLSFGTRRSFTVGIRVETPAAVGRAEDQLVGILRRLRQTPPDKADDFSINKSAQLATMYERLTGTLYGIVWAIGFITLFVGGVGVMNIMLMSVYERTREIGVRRALGARKRTIISQFLLEALVVSAVGGTLGTLVGLSAAQVVGLLSPLEATVRPMTAVFGVCFTALAGLLFGIWPAARAAALNPIEALRQE